jgi:choline dehydrogenase-like flavoprotein
VVAIKESIVPSAAHFDVIIIGSGAGGGTLVHKLAPSGIRILLLERGDYVPREKIKWDPRLVNLEGKYQTKEVWRDKDGAELHPHTNYNVGGNTKFYGKDPTEPPPVGPLQSLVTGQSEEARRKIEYRVNQLRKRRIEKVILAGPAGNLCVEAHLRDFLEQGFEVAMVRDATAGTKNEEGDGYQAALVNFRFMAHALWTTRHTVGLMREASAPPEATWAAVNPPPAA